MKNRNSKGNQIAELPAALILLILGFAFPLLIMASIFYKVYMFDCIIKNGCQLGAEQTDLASATTVAQNYVTGNTPAGITCALPTVSLVQRPVTYNSGTPPVSKTYQAYFLQVQGTGQMDPLVRLASFFGTSVPGLTGPIQLQSTQAVYFENQQAVTAGS
jgi:hypothetical protein